MSTSIGSPPVWFAVCTEPNCTRRGSSVHARRCCWTCPEGVHTTECDGRNWWPDVPTQPLPENFAVPPEHREGAVEYATAYQLALKGPGIRCWMPHRANDVTYYARRSAWDAGRKDGTVERVRREKLKYARS
jgi:hypothetical protein